MLDAGFGDPVLVVRPHSARPPDGYGRTVGKRRPTLGHPLACTVNHARAFAGGSASIHSRTLTGGAEKNSRSTAHCTPLSFWAIAHRGVAESRFPCHLESTFSLSHADGWMSTLLPAHRHQHSPTCDADTLHRRRPDQLQVPAPSATDLARCSLARSVMWLAVFKMMHRSGGRQGYGQLLAAFAAFSSTLRSLTVNGPARTSPRPFGHP
jgi:hypothetical protein